jgi:hypothetical protein
VLKKARAGEGQQAGAAAAAGDFTIGDTIALSNTRYDDVHPSRAAFSKS